MTILRSRKDRANGLRAQRLSESAPTADLALTAVVSDRRGTASSLSENKGTAGRPRKGSTRQRRGLGFCIVPVPLETPRELATTERKAVVDRNRRQSYCGSFFILFQYFRL